MSPPPLEPVIGLEVHAQLRARTKLFCGCPTDFGAPPNSQVCPVCLGLPGALPVLNRKAVELAVRVATALGATVNARSIFARKNYFYPDLPKGYQISQYDEPLSSGGGVPLDLDGERRTVPLIRIHMEDDAGKNIHDPAVTGGGASLVDLNRSGVPLIEIVSTPAIRTPAEASAYLKSLRSILLYLDACDGNMEEGSLRCDANVSLKPKGSEALGTRAEVKNLNSFKYLEEALEHEIARQEKVLRSGGSVVQETRLYDSKRGVTESMRSKEEAHDYRYFPEPDLLPLEVPASLVASIRGGLPELPRARRERLVRTHGIPEADAAILTAQRELADYFEASVRAGAPARSAANWIRTEVLARAGDPRDLPRAPVTPAALAELLGLLGGGTLSGPAAKEVFGVMWSSGRPAAEIVRERGLSQVSDEVELERVARGVVEANPKQVAQYRGGKESVLAFFMGQVMKLSRGRANPQRTTEILKRLLAG